MFCCCALNSTYLLVCAMMHVLAGYSPSKVHKPQTLLSMHLAPLPGAPLIIDPVNKHTHPHALACARACARSLKDIHTQVTWAPTP